MKRLLILTTAFFLLKTLCVAQNLVWSNFDTSSKIDINKFAVLTEREVDLAKSLEDFVNNRARLTLTDVGNRISPAELQKPDFPFPCECVLKKDTIFITTALGMMSGLGIITAVYKNQFAASFFQESDNTPVFKLRKNDTLYIDRISVPTNEQKLTLFKKPSFTSNEIIFGAFIGQFKTFYELEGSSKPPLAMELQGNAVF